MKKVFFILSLFCSIIAFGQNSDFLLQQRLPEWFLSFYHKSEISKKYLISDYINPFYYEGDFNGDKNIDIAVVIKDIQTQKKGILIVHAKTNDYYILGAGNKFDRGKDNFSWMDVWKVYRENTIESEGETPQKVILKWDALWVEKSEAYSAVIYWDGKKYVWYQQ